MKPIQLVLSTLAFAVLGATATVAAASEYTPVPELDNAVATQSREQVRAETLQAIRGGQIPRNQAEVDRIVAQASPLLKTRAQVIAETREAARLGLIPGNELEQIQWMPSAEALRHINAAGQRALNVTLASL